MCIAELGGQCSVLFILPTIKYCLWIAKHQDWVLSGNSTLLDRGAIPAITGKDCESKPYPIGEKNAQWTFGIQTLTLWSNVQWHDLLSHQYRDEWVMLPPQWRQACAWYFEKLLTAGHESQICTANIVDCICSLIGVIVSLLSFLQVTFLLTQGFISFQLCRYWKQSVCTARPVEWHFCNCTCTHVRVAAHAKISGVSYIRNICSIIGMGLLFPPRQFAIWS